MKYIVTVGDREFQVELGDGWVSVDGVTVPDAGLVSLPGGPLWQLRLNGSEATIAIVPKDGQWSILHEGRVWAATAVDERSHRLRAMAGGIGGATAGGVIRAPMPGLVLRLEVAVGDRVAKGAGLAVLEAMKMENEIRAPGEGVVSRIVAEPGKAVEKGAPLIELEPVG